MSWCCAVAGCGGNVLETEEIDTGWHGYQCQKCGAKYQAVWKLRRT